MPNRAKITGCWALVPIKARAACKSRLKDIPAEARRRLVELMLDNVIAALLAADAIERIAIVTPEPSPVPPGVLVLPDEGGGLNEALNCARNRVRKLGATELVILPADLPFVRGADVNTLVRRGRQSAFALASDTTGVGTNALYLAPHLPFRFCFGAHSREKHLRQALQLGLKPALVRSDRLEFDIDTQDDLRRLDDGSEGRFRSFLSPNRSFSCTPTPRQI